LSVTVIMIEGWPGPGMTYFEELGSDGANC
jgi:hypothetical protein